MNLKAHFFDFINFINCLSAGLTTESYVLSYLSSQWRVQKRLTNKGLVHRRKTPVGPVGVGCVTHCLDDVRHGLRWAEETSPETYEKALGAAVQGSLRYEAKEILLYLLVEENAPVGDLNPLRLFEMKSKTIWLKAMERGWGINKRGSIFGHENLRFLDLARKDLDLVRWCLDHGAKIDDSRIDDWAHPCILESATKYGNAEVYKFLQSLGAQPGPHDLVIAAKRAPINFLEDAMGLVRYFLNDLGWDVNREAPHGRGLPICCGIGPEISEGTVSHACSLSKEQIHIAVLTAWTLLTGQNK
ncbi:unnamed protein product [Penicillium pancosmium]